MTNVADQFEDFMGGRFKLRRGKAHDREQLHLKCNKKLCFYSTDQQLLAAVLLELMEREDGWAAKYSTYNRSGVFLGRAFFTSEAAVGQLWQSFKGHPQLFCSVQDDDWVDGYRSR